jgi:hypothetical protein
MMVILAVVVIMALSAQPYPADHGITGKEYAGDAAQQKDQAQKTPTPATENRSSNSQYSAENEPRQTASQLSENDPIVRYARYTFYCAVASTIIIFVQAVTFYYTLKATRRAAKAAEDAARAAEQAINPLY